ncbi:MAG TPA: hypothetical protein VK357_14425 [Rubrobacteraceae bacterium]|nr:hypothetical protein [Rubrobacteraceae bacterium]
MCIVVSIIHEMLLAFAVLDERALREVSQEAGLDADQHNGGLGPGENNGLRAIRGEAKGIGAQSVPTVATKEQVLYYGTASPGKVRALLADHKETVG